MKNDLPSTSDMPLTQPGATQLASLIARGSTTAREVLEQHIARITQVNSQLNAMASMPRALIPMVRNVLRMVGQHSMAAGLAPFGRYDTAHYWELVEARIAYANEFKRALDEAQGGPFDLILCPPCATPALTHGSSRDLATLGAYACLYNLLGYPAGVVPVSRVRAGEESDRPHSRDIVEARARQVEEGSAGLPVGVQVIARPWQDHVALAGMAAIESAIESAAARG